MRKNLLTKNIHISEEHDILMKECMKNHIVMYNKALQLLYKDNYLDLKTLQKTINNYINENNVFPIVKLSLFIEIYYLYKKFKRGIKTQKNITNVQYMTFIIANLQKDYIKINTSRTTSVILKLADFLTDDEFAKLNNVVTFINISYSNKNNNYVLSAFS